MRRATKMHTRKEKGMTIIIRPSGVEFKFDTTDENAFLISTILHDL